MTRRATVAVLLSAVLSAVLGAVLAAVLGVLGLLLAGTAAAAQPAGPQPPRAVMLLLDTSGSMGESGAAAARAAALAYLTELPADVLVGLVGFSEVPEVLVAPTADRAQVRTALDNVRPHGDTALYDAVHLALSALDGAGLGPQAQLRLVVLSDGDDTTSVENLADTEATLAARGIPTDMIAFRYGAGDTAALDALAGAAGGRVYPAQDAAQLAGAFAAIARGFAGPAASAPPAPPAEPLVVGSAALVAMLAAVFVAVLLAVLMLAGSRPDERARTLAARLARYGPRAGAGRPEGDGANAAGLATDLAGRVLRGTSVERTLAARLDLAAIGRRPAEWALLGTTVCVALAVVLGLVSGSLVFGLVAGVAIGWLGMRLFLSSRIGRRRAAFGEQLPDVLQLVAGSLRSGFSLAQALTTVVREGSQPAAAEFSRALGETRVGVEIEIALDRVADRMDSTDLHWVVMAIRIQREVGGNLAEVLLTTVSTMRERAQMRRQVKALSAEGRLSAYILIALPVVVGAWLFLSRGDYMRPLYTTAIGVAMLVGSAVMVVVGTFWMRKLVKVEV